MWQPQVDAEEQVVAVVLDPGLATEPEQVADEPVDARALAHRASRVPRARPPDAVSPDTPSQ